MFAEERPQGQAMQGISIFAYTRSSVPYACSGRSILSARHSSPKPEGRLAQLVRAPALQAGGRRFESCTAHHPNPYLCGDATIGRLSFESLATRLLPRPVFL
jgi:hypothetical protein